MSEAGDTIDFSGLYLDGDKLVEKLQRLNAFQAERAKYLYIKNNRLTSLDLEAVCELLPNLAWLDAR